MKPTTKTPKRPLWEVLPQELRDVTLNGCRTPGCPNYGVPPVVSPGYVDPNYRVERRDARPHLVCTACRRRSSIYAVRAYALELDRIETRGGALLIPGCPKPSCPSFGKPVTQNATLYGGFGTTSSGRRRYRCKRCGSTFVFGDEHRAITNKAILKTLIRFLVNGVPLRGQARIARIDVSEIYRLLPFIWLKFVQFEEYKLRRFFALKKNARIRLHLCTDGQDQMVNWWSRDRRDPVQVSCITTADNLSGFVLRTDLNFDGSTGNAGVHFEELVDEGDYALPEAKSLHARYEEQAFLKAVIWNLEREREALPRHSRRRQQLNGLLLQAKMHLAPAAKSPGTSFAGSPPDGVIVKRNYTAVAHLTSLHRLLPAQAKLHFSTDRDATLVSAALMAFRDRILDNRVDVTIVSFDKTMTIDVKRGRIHQYNRRLADFRSSSAMQGAHPAVVRQAFIAAFATEMPPYPGIHGQVWSVPVQTLYEPDKRVGIVSQRHFTDPEDAARHRWALLDRASLHATDTFFNYVRSRVSYMTRGSDTKGPSGNYAPRRPYRPDLLQMVLDIVRIHYNWCEPRVRRRAADADGATGTLLEDADSTTTDRRKKEEEETPAMRLGIARAPTRVDTILYSNWIK